MHSSCILHACFMHSSCTLHAFSMHASCILHEFFMYSSSILQSCFMHPSCILHSLGSESSCIQHLPSVIVQSHFSQSSTIHDSIYCSIILLWLIRQSVFNHRWLFLHSFFIHSSMIRFIIDTISDDYLFILQLDAFLMLFCDSFCDAILIHSWLIRRAIFNQSPCSLHSSLILDAWLMHGWCKLRSFFVHYSSIILCSLLFNYSLFIILQWSLLLSSFFLLPSYYLFIEPLLFIHRTITAGITYMRLATLRGPQNVSHIHFHQPERWA